MQKAHKDLLRALVADLRHTLQGSGTLLDTPNGDGLRGDLDRELERIGIGRSGLITPLDALPNPTPHDVRAHRTAEVQLANLSKPERPAARAEIVERAAYTWINRLLALRTMEARGLIEETLRANPAYEGISEALYLLRYEAPQRTAGADGGWWAVVEDACQAQAQILPGLFDLNDPNAALRPSTSALLRCLQIVGRPELDSVFVDPDVISWSYQFYQEEAKGRVYAKLGRGGKLETRSEIAAATQLFTEPYMVKWLLQNSLGRSYHKTYPDSTLPQTWEYYIDREKILANDNDEDPSSNRPNAQPRFSLSELTFMDPCTGSGHFQREAFDLLFAMYREQHPDMEARAIADRILAHHLHGIDIDPRSVQLAAVTLVLRAWETIGSGPYTPPTLNLATTPSHLDAGALDRHLQRHPEDAVYRPILQGVFAALAQAPILGSLLKPEEHLDAALQEFRKQKRGGQTGLLAEDEETNRLLAELARHDPSELKKLLMERIARSFAREAKESDVAARLLGREASEGLHLLQLLDRKYAVVVTNPPYMGQRNYGLGIKDYVTRMFPLGKQDLYSAFILRCLELACSNGRVSLVTMQSWAFLGSYQNLRGELLSNYRIENVAHLGSNAFDKEMKLHVGVAVICFSLVKAKPQNDFTTTAVRCIAAPNTETKSELLRTARTAKNGTLFAVQQQDLRAVPGEVLAYWIPRTLLKMFGSNPRLSESALVSWGASTSDNSRFIRQNWESPVSSRERWVPHRKGGGYQKWAGFDECDLDWGNKGSRAINFILERYPYLNGNYEIKLRPYTFFRPGWSYTKFSNGCLAFRQVGNHDTTNAASPAVMPTSTSGIQVLGAILNARISSYLIRAICNKMDVEAGYIGELPLPNFGSAEGLTELSEYTTSLKQSFVGTSLTERGFLVESVKVGSQSIHALLHTVEAVIEVSVLACYRLQKDEIEVVIKETGTPAGWHPLIADYDHLPELPAALDLPPLPQAVLDFLAGHERIAPNAQELARIKANLQALYEAGPGARADNLDLDDLDHHGDDDDEALSGAYIPIPTETFLEELSVKLQIHPISVYWLLEELRTEGVRCKPEEKRLLEDRLSVIVLRLLGHRWPKQIEAGEPVPAWADRDGVIPLTTGTGESTLADLVRTRLRAEDGDLGAQQAEALLHELTGRSLEEWLRRDFFRRHTSQFKKRPSAWHLASSPVAGGRKRTATPAFECIVYYHATGANASLPGRGGDILARIRTQYVDRLLAPAQRDLAQARRDGDETAAAKANALILELEDFARRLRQVEEGGFACQELEEVIANEPLDRWAGDGVFAPAGRAELLAQEEAWQVDINDGVRVNIAPLQSAGLLAGDVLARADVTKAIADRARWRSDERRWVRVGKLPRCGWMDESVPESPQWTALAPEREKERQRLEERRQKVLEELQS